MSSSAAPSSVRSSLTRRTMSCSNQYCRQHRAATGARLHAYCWTTEAIYLAVQIDEISLGHFMQWVKSRYARGIQRKLGERGHLFQVRYDSVIIDPKMYLTSLIHYIHYVPVLKSLVDRPEDFAYSSHPAYANTREVPWVHCGTTRRLLGKRDEQAEAYQQLMAEAPTPEAVKLVERGMPKNTWHSWRAGAGGSRGSSAQAIDADDAGSDHPRCLPDAGRDARRRAVEIEIAETGTRSRCDRLAHDGAWYRDAGGDLTLPRARVVDAFQDNHLVSQAPAGSVQAGRVVAHDADRTGRPRCFQRGLPGCRAIRGARQWNRSGWDVLRPNVPRSWF